MAQGQQTDYTTVTVKDDTWKRLNSRKRVRDEEDGRRGQREESMDDVISRALDALEASG